MKLQILSCLLVCVAFTQAAVPEYRQENELSKQYAEISPAVIGNITGKEYYISGNGFNVDIKQATRLCLDFGMRLVSIETAEENEAIGNFLQENSLGDNVYWTSGRRFLGEFQWVATSNFFSFTSWSVAEPDNPSSDVDVCVEMQGSNKTWSDNKCNVKQGFICE